MPLLKICPFYDKKTKGGNNKPIKVSSVIFSVPLVHITTSFSLRQELQPLKHIPTILMLVILIHKSYLFGSKRKYASKWKLDSNERFYSFVEIDTLLANLPHTTICLSSSHYSYSYLVFLQPFSMLSLTILCTMIYKAP